MALRSPADQFRNPTDPGGATGVVRSTAPGAGDIYPILTRWLDTSTGTLYTSTGPGTWQTAYAADTVTVGTAPGTVAAGDHTHAGVYAPANHHHDSRYAPTAHQHDTQYAPLAHDHPGLLPAGGSAGQVLTKSGPGDFAATWLTPESAGGGGTATASVAVLESIAALRAAASLTAPAICLLGYYSRGDLGGGMLYHDPADSSSADDGARTIVNLNSGRRYKRVLLGVAHPAEWGVVVGQSPGVIAARLQAAVTWAQSAGVRLIDTARVLTTNASLTIPSGVHFDAPHTTLKQADGANLAHILLLSGGGLQTVRLTVDGNRANQASPPIGIIYRDIAERGSLIDCRALNCDIGHIVEGSCEGTRIITHPVRCRIGTMIRGGPQTPQDPWPTPDEQAVETHYHDIDEDACVVDSQDREGSAVQVTADIVIRGEICKKRALYVSPGNAVIRVSGYARGVGQDLTATQGGVQVDGGKVHFADFQLIGKNAGYAAWVNTPNRVSGSIIADAFGGGCLIAAALNGSSLLFIGETFPLYNGLQIGLTSGATVNAFHFLPGSRITSTPAGTAAVFEKSNGCRVDFTHLPSPTFSGVNAGTGAADSIVFGAGSRSDTVRLGYYLRTRRIGAITGATGATVDCDFSCTTAERDAMVLPAGQIAIVRLSGNRTTLRPEWRVNGAWKSMALVD